MFASLAFYRTICTNQIQDRLKSNVENRPFQDLKSCDLTVVWVQVPPRVLFQNGDLLTFQQIPIFFLSARRRLLDGATAGGCRAAVLGIAAA